jgi:insulysin
LYSFVKEGHPMRAFTWGNRKSLQTDPVAAGVDVRHELTEFYTRHYLPQRMHLVLRGTQSLDVLQAMVVECFSSLKVSVTPVPPLSYESHGLPFGDDNSPVLVFMKSIKQQPSICLTWALPPTLQTLYRAMPDGHLSHLLGHEVRFGVGHCVSCVCRK